MASSDDEFDECIQLRIDNPFLAYDGSESDISVASVGSVDALRSM